MSAGPRSRPFAFRRIQLGLNLDRAAARLGCHPRYLRALELGRSPLSLPLAERMAVEYSTTVSELTRPAESAEQGGGR
jgi:transcriptional regulator with XRE-family HTH domain